MLSNRGVETEKVDLHAHIDRRLTLRENEMNISRMYGVQRSSSYERVMGEFNDNRQTGTTVKSRDRVRTAKPPGARKAKSGRWYNERRANRSDVNQKRGKKQRGKWL